MSARLTQSVRLVGQSSAFTGGAGAAGSLVLFGLAYAAAAKAGAELATVNGVSTVWPAAGVAVAGLLVLGVWAWPAISSGPTSRPTPAAVRSGDSPSENDDA